MEPRIKTSGRADVLEWERFRDLVASPEFAILRERIEAELERGRLALERPDDDREAARLRGVVAALRMVLVLPERLLAEMKPK